MIRIKNVISKDKILKDKELPGILIKEENQYRSWSFNRGAHSGQNMGLEMSLAPTTVTNKEEKEIMEFSRFIHHNIDFRGIRLTVIFFILPIVLLLLAVVAMAVYETLILLKYVTIKYEIKLMDAFQYSSWASVLEFQYMELRRMLGNGMVKNDTFAKFGKPNLADHLTGLLLSPGQAYQIFNNTWRAKVLIETSEYRDWYDTEDFISSNITIMTFDNQKKATSSNR